MKDGNGVDEESAGGDCHQLEKQHGNKASFLFFLSFLCATLDHVERDGLGSDQFVLCMREHQEVCITKGQRTEDKTWHRGAKQKGTPKKSRTCLVNSCICWSVLFSRIPYTLLLHHVPTFLDRNRSSLSVLCFRDSVGTFLKNGTSLFQTRLPHGLHRGPPINQWKERGLRSHQRHSNC